MNRSIIALAAAVALAAPFTAGLSPAQAQGKGHPATYQLDGDAGGSKFEGIGVTRNQRIFYVTEVTGGEIHRGWTRSGETQEWMAEGADGRFTARGVTTDKKGRTYVAGGPNGLGTDRPDLWVYAKDGTLLAALKVDEPNVFLNDVTIGPDGAAYFTNSNAPQVFRVTREGGTWDVSLWADETGTITTPPGFNLGGIVVAPDRQSLVVAQGTLGLLWRFDLETGEATLIETAGADLTNADGLVLRGHRLYVVRNFSRVLATLRLDAHATTATLLSELATDPSRVFTTAKLARGRLLLVDSKFDEPVASPPYEVVSLRVPR